MLARASQQVQKFVAERFILAGEIGNHPDHIFWNVSSPVFMRGEETCRAGNVLPDLYRFRMARCEALGQLSIQLYDPAATVRGAIVNGDAVGGCRPRGLLPRSVDPHRGFRGKGPRRTD